MNPKWPPLASSRFGPSTAAPPAQWKERRYIANNAHWPNFRMADDPTFKHVPRALLLRLGCWSGGQIGVVGIEDKLSLPVRLLLPDLDQFAGITDRRSAFRVLDRERVGSVKVSEFTGFRDFDFRDLPGHGCVGTEQARPGFPYRLPICGDLRVGRKQYCVIGIERDSPFEIISRGRAGPLLIESLDRRRIGRTAVTRRRRGARRGHESGRNHDK